ncbi:MAG TPA: hypothetical protein VHJ17_18795, partial [Thermomonospora sp.]|nr:hypothetical protein [Thermomonospora sp.]
ATVTAVAATAVVYASQDRDSTTPDATVQAQPAARTTPGRSPAGVGLAGGYRMARGTISPPGNLSNPVHKVAYYYATSENAITLVPKPGCTGPQCDLVVRGWTIVLPKERIKRDVPLRRLPDGSYRSADGAPARLELKAPQATGFTLVMHVGNVTVTWQATRA